MVAQALLFGERPTFGRPEVPAVEYTKRLARSGFNMQGVITMDRGQCAFYVHQEMGLYKSIEQENDIGVEFQEGIIIWHIATELQKFSSPKAEDMTTPRLQETW